MANWRAIVSILVCYVLLVCYLVFTGRPDPGYERLWLAAAFVAGVVYLIPVVVFMLVYSVLKK